MAKYSVRITVYHRIDVEADSQADALEQAEGLIWDDHIKDVIINAEEADDE
jgi:hypothetical protein